MAGARLLLDTHALLWWLLDDSGLSPRARTVIADPNNQLLVSAASGWEIATKQKIGKLPDFSIDAADLAGHIRRAGLEFLPVTFDHAVADGALPGAHQSRDLMATTRREAMALSRYCDYLPQLDKIHAAEQLGRTVR